MELEADKEYGYLVPDRITGLEEVEELRRLCPERRWNFVREYFCLTLTPVVTLFCLVSLGGNQCHL